MIPLAIPDLSGNEKKYLNECIDSTFVSSVGKFVTEIEELSADKSGTSYGVATSSGTTALHLALMSIGVKTDDIVIIPTFTFIATANAIKHCGAIPWLMDIDKDTWTMNVNQLSDELDRKTELRGNELIYKENGLRVVAIMPVCALGNVPDMDPIIKIAQKYNLPVVLDAAAAIGATYKNRKIGELALATAFSFNGNKTITAGGGGMVVTNDGNLAKKMKHISTTARVTAEYDHDMVGYNYRMTNIQAAVGCAQMERMEQLVEKKQYIRNYYKKKLTGIERLDLFPNPEYQNSSCWFSGIVIKNSGIEELREICSELRNNGIEGRSFWKPIHMQKPYEDAIMADDLSIATDLWDTILVLPCSTGITEDDLAFISDVVRKIIENRK